MNEPENSTALEKVPEPINPLALMTSWGFGEVAVQLYTSIDQSVPAGRQLVFQLMNGKGLSVDELGAGPFEFTDFLISPSTFPDPRTGEVIRSLLIRLVMADGRWLSAHSPTLAKSVLTFHTAVQLAPWKPPIKATIRKEKTRQGYSFFQFAPIFDIVPQTRPKGK